MAEPLTGAVPATVAAPRLLPVAAVGAGIVSLAVGTSFAERLFPLVGAEGTTGLRVGFAALVLLAVWRPWRRPLTAGDALAVTL